MHGEGLVRYFHVGGMVLNWTGSGSGSCNRIPSVGKAITLQFLIHVWRLFNAIKCPL